MANVEEFVDSVRKKAAETGFSGVVSVFRENTSLYQEAFGYADIAEKRKNNVDTRFGIASGTKLFTALGIGTLIDAGKLSPEMTVREIFGTDLSFIDSRATVAHLLSHTSGMYDYFDEEADIDFDTYSPAIPWYKLETPSDYLPLFEGKETKFTPGQRFSYSNGGFVLLGAIIERISGNLYRDYIEEHVFRPVGMDDSGYFAFNQLPENTAYGYHRNKDSALETNIYHLPIRGGGDGGAYTTLGDVQKLWRAIFDYRILSKKLIDLFTTPHTAVNERLDYGYGIYVPKYRNTKMLFFVGGDTGVGFDSRYLPERGTGFTVISNFSDGEETMREVILSHFEGMVTE